jgi:hypothetical protein
LIRPVSTPSINRPLHGRRSRASQTRAAPKLIYRNIGSAVVGNYAYSEYQPENERSKKSTTGADAMTSAAQAFLFTAELFALSFLAIFLIWLADRLWSGFLGKR